MKVRMSDCEKNLEDYFRKETLEFKVLNIEVADTITIPFIKNSDLLDYYPDDTSFYIDFEIECECEGTPTIYSMVSFYTYNGKLEYGGIGGYATDIYGIRIDTEEDSYCWEESILEFIDPGEILIMPIYFPR